MPDFLICPCNEQREHCHCTAERYNDHHRLVTCCENSNDVRFGLFDDPPPAAVPAYILNMGQKDDWIAEVNNTNQYNITFKAIDNCVPFDGEKCEGMLIYNNNIVFVELKNRESHGWLAKGRRQLTNSIRLFVQNHNDEDYNIKDSYVCNGSRPRLPISETTQNQIFKDETADILDNEGIQLHARQDIIL